VLTAPYVSTSAFTAHPTYLDLDDLRSGSSLESDQTAELNNVLLIASDWADGYAEQPLGAHVVTQNCRARCDRFGVLKFHLDDRPFKSLVQIGYGYTPSSLSVLTTPQTWVQNNNLAVTIGGGSSGAWSGSLQFGFPSVGSELYVQAVYSAGLVGTQLAADAAIGAMTLTVADPTGITPGGRYRIWEPGAEETVTVSSSWVPPTITVPVQAPLPASVTLAAATQYAHTAGNDFSEWPADLRLSVINYAVAQLMRPDTSAEDSYPDTRLASGTRQDDSRKDGSGLVSEAERNIERFVRIR
jgi:hypothetical protein